VDFLFVLLLNVNSLVQCLVIVNIFFLLSGKFSFHGRSLHHISSTPNPYEQAISIIGQTMSKFDEDNLIPCFGFGDGNEFKCLLSHYTIS
jgi:hypothetical protein